MRVPVGHLPRSDRGGYARGDTSRPLLGHPRRQPPGDRGRGASRDAAALDRAVPDQGRDRAVARTISGRGSRSACRGRLGARQSLIETALAEALLRAHDLEEALPLLERLTIASPGDPALLLMFGDALVEHQQFDRAIPVFEAAVKQDPTVLPAQASLGRAYVQAGRFADAVPHLEAASATTPTAICIFSSRARIRRFSAETMRARRWPNIRRAIRKRPPRRRPMAKKRH